MHKPGDLLTAVKSVVGYGPLLSDQFATDDVMWYKYSPPTEVSTTLQQLCMHNHTHHITTPTTSVLWNTHQVLVGPAVVCITRLGLVTSPYVENSEGGLYLEIESSEDGLYIDISEGGPYIIGTLEGRLCKGEPL